MAIAAASGVFAFGGVETLGFAPAQFIVVLLAAFLFWREGLPEVPLRTALVLVALIALPILHLIPLPPAVVESLSAPRGAIHTALREAAVPLESLQTISIYPYETLMALLRLVCYVLVFLLALRNSQRLQRQPALAVFMIAIGIFEAAYGITQYLTGFPYIFFYKKAEPVLEATGTYINRNHYAGLLEMCLPFAAASMLNHSVWQGRRGGGFWRRAIVAPQSPRFLLDAVLFILILVGLMVSLSRAGIAAGLIGVCVAGVVMFQQHRRSMFAILAVIVLTAVAYSFWLGLAPLLERFGNLWSSMPDSEMRLAIWRDTIQMIRDSPLLGTGLGTYGWMSIHYQSALLTYRYEHAHNDLLETAAEMGIPLAIVLWCALIALLVRLVRKASHLHHSGDRALAAGCSGAMASLLLHSLTDFNLQIPANALIFTWITGAAAALTQRARTLDDILVVKPVTWNLFLGRRRSTESAFAVRKNRNPAVQDFSDQWR